MTASFTVILTAMLVIGSVVPVEEMSRSVWYTASGVTWSDNLKSLQNAGVSSTNFVGTNPDGDFFYTYLARKD